MIHATIDRTSVTLNSDELQAVIHFLAGARAETPLSPSGGAESGKPQSATETTAAAASTSATPNPGGILAIGTNGNTLCNALAGQIQSQIRPMIHQISTINDSCHG